MKVAIMLADSNGCYPVPASKGGAVSTLVEHLIAQNSKEKQCDMVMITYYDVEAEKLSKKYKNVEFVWIKVPKIVKAADAAGFWFVRKVLKKQKSVSFKSLFSLMWYIWKGTKVLKREQFDKLVLENNVPMAMIIKRSKYSGDYYYHFHNVPRISANCEDVFAGCKVILCVSQFVADCITSPDSAIGEIPKEKAKVLYNCVDTDKFAPIKDVQKLQEYRNRFGLRESDKVIVFVGRLSEEKGIDKLLQAVQLIDDKAIKVLVVGSYMYNSDVKDEYQEHLHNLAENMNDRIVFTGYISQDELPNVYGLADVAVLPSMWDEPAGLTMIEAMACGCPVITTNSGGIPEYTSSNCSIVLDRDEYLVKNIEENVRKLLSDSAYKDRIGALAENHAHKHNPRAYYENFMTLIGE